MLFALVRGRLRFPWTFDGADSVNLLGEVIENPV
jgi:hypothetical protein